MVEIMVCLSIAAILTMTAASMLVFSSRTATHYAGKADEREIGEAVCGLVKRQLEYVRYLRIDSQGDRALPEEKVLCFSKNGTVYVDGDDLYGAQYYGGRRINCRIMLDDEDGQIMQIELYLEDEQGQTLHRSRIGLDFYNMKLNGEWISYETSMVSDGMIDSGNQDVYLYYMQNHAEEGQGEMIE